MDALLAEPFTMLAAAAGATFVTGLAGSPHCALMCGPLACAGGGAPRGDRAALRARLRAAAGWHLGRMGAYATVGAALGALGRGALAMLQAPPARALPWVMAAGLVLSAFEVGRRLPALPGAARVSLALARLGAAVSPGRRALLRGAATPFLPCGLLYGAFVVAAGAGSAAAGAIIMLTFALGAVPALVFVQANARWLAARPRAGRLVRRLVPLAAAAVVVWRALVAPSGTGAPACHGGGAHAAAARTGAATHTLAEKRAAPASRTGAVLR